jgi:hypothetical protein
MCCSLFSWNVMNKNASKNHQTAMILTFICIQNIMQVKYFNINHTHDQDNHKPMFVEEKTEKYYAEEKLLETNYFAFSLWGPHLIAI